LRIYLRTKCKHQPYSSESCSLDCSAYAERNWRACEEEVVTLLHHFEDKTCPSCFSDLAVWVSDGGVSLQPCECGSLTWKRAISKCDEFYATRDETIEKLLEKLWRNIEAALDYREDTGVLDAFNELASFLESKAEKKKEEN